MFIQTEETPNPESLKFLPGRVVSEIGTHMFSQGETISERLPQQLLKVKDVEAVFFGYDFITITKNKEALWPTLKPPILAEIMDHFTAGFPALEGRAPQRDAEGEDEKDPLVRQIKELIETRVRPAVAMDGGDIIFDRFESGVVYLELRGACSGCPSSTATLKSGVENMLRHYIPEVKEVRATHG